MFENRDLGGYDKNDIGAGRIKLQSFKMLDGENLQSTTGQKRYILKYEAVILFPNGFERDAVAPGGTRTKTGELHFQMTEDGWRGPDGKLY